MHTSKLVTLLLLLPALLQAEPWAFTEKQLLTSAQGDKVFHHLDGTGRNHLSVAGDTVAAVWEDNHSGSPQVYISIKRLGAKKFSAPKQLSTGKTAFAPVITPYSANQFLVSWEQDRKVFVSHVSASGVSKPMQVSSARSSQAAVVVTSPQQAVVAWSEKSGRFWQIKTAHVTLDVKGKPQSVQAIKSVEAEAAQDNQLYPTLAFSNGITTVMWEDRRNGHTMILYSQARAGEDFGAHQGLNEIVQKSSDYGRGNGVTRAAMAAYADKGLAVTWMDKRGFSTGYDIYAAHYDEAGNKFGVNQMVQDTFGNNIAQWNPAIAATAQGDIAVSWDDNRDESSDVWLSWKTEEGWSDDTVITPASGEGQQTGAALAFDNKRNLHVIWLEQASENGPTQLYYASGRYQQP